MPHFPYFFKRRMEMVSKYYNVLSWQKGNNDLVGLMIQSFWLSDIQKYLQLSYCRSFVRAGAMDAIAPINFHKWQTPSLKFQKTQGRKDKISLKNVLLGFSDILNKMALWNFSYECSTQSQWSIYRSILTKFNHKV